MTGYEASGQLLNGDDVDLEALNLTDGTELGRVDSEAEMQSVISPTPAGEGTIFSCAFFSMTRERVVS